MRRRPDRQRGGVEVAGRSVQFAGGLRHLRQRGRGRAVEIGDQRLDRARAGVARAHRLALRAGEPLAFVLGMFALGLGAGALEEGAEHGAHDRGEHRHVVDIDDRQPEERTRRRPRAA